MGNPRYAQLGDDSLGHHLGPPAASTGRAPHGSAQFCLMWSTSAGRVIPIAFLGRSQSRLFCRGRPDGLPLYVDFVIANLQEELLSFKGKRLANDCGKVRGGCAGWEPKILRSPERVQRGGRSPNGSQEDVILTFLPALDRPLCLVVHEHGLWHFADWRRLPSKSSSAASCLLQTDAVRGVTSKRDLGFVGLMQTLQLHQRASAVGRAPWMPSPTLKFWMVGRPSRWPSALAQPTPVPSSVRPGFLRAAHELRGASTLYSLQESDWEQLASTIACLMSHWPACVCVCQVC